MGYNSKELKASSPAKGPPKPKDVIYDPMGQWNHPGEVTKIPGGDITMRNVPYPVLGVDDLGNQQMMYPEMDYTFPGQSVTEYPMHKMPDGSIMRNDEMPQAKTGGWLDTMQDGGAASLQTVPTYISGKQENQYTPHKRLLAQAKANAEATNQYNATKAFVNSASFFPGIPGLIANSLSGGMDYVEGNNAEAALQLVPGRVSRTINGASNLMTAKDLYNYSSIPEESQASTLPYLTDEYKRNLFKPKSITYEEFGGDFDEMKRGGAIKGLHQFTSRNIKSSINKLMLRNEHLFGPGGKKIYAPNAKNWLDKYK